MKYKILVEIETPIYPTDGDVISYLEPITRETKELIYTVIPLNYD